MSVLKISGIQIHILKKLTAANSERAMLFVHREILKVHDTGRSNS